MNVVPFIVAQTGLPVILRSGAGSSKTSLIEKFAEKMQRNFYPVFLNSRDREDVLGYPIYNQELGEIEFKMDSSLNIKHPAVVFFDELNTAPEHVRIVAQRIINEKILGNNLLTDVWFFIAGNPPGVSAGAQPFEPAIVNRCAVFNWEPPVNWWKTFMILSGKQFYFNRLEGKKLSHETWSPNFPVLNKNLYEENLEKYIPIFVQFFSNNPQFLSEGDKTDPYCSIRSATNAVSAYCSILSVDNIEGLTKDEALIMALTSCLGEATAIKLKRFITSLDLPDPISVLEGKVPLPSEKEHDKAQIVIMSLVAKSNNVEMFNRVMKFLKEVYDKRSPELAYFAIVSMAEQAKKLPKDKLIIPRGITNVISDKFKVF